MGASLLALAKSIYYRCLACAHITFLRLFPRQKCFSHVSRFQLSKISQLTNQSLLRCKYFAPLHRYEQCDKIIYGRNSPQTLLGLTERAPIIYNC